MANYDAKNMIFLRKMEPKREPKRGHGSKREPKGRQKVQKGA